MSLGLLTACGTEIKPPDIEEPQASFSQSEDDPSSQESGQTSVEFSRESLDALTPEQFQEWRKQFLKNLERNKKINADVKAWINIAPFGINYPVVKPLDNEQYVRQSLNGDYDVSGTLFFDQETKSLKDKNVIIYGHNMKNGTMFACLNDLASEELFNECLVAVTTEEETRLYLPQAVYITEDLQGYIENTPTNIEDIFVEESEVTPEITLNKDDGVLTLTTCDGDSSDLNRRVVQFVRYTPF